MGPGFDSRSVRFGRSVIRLEGSVRSLLPTVNWVLASPDGEVDRKWTNSAHAPLSVAQVLGSGLRRRKEHFRTVTRDRRVLKRVLQ